MKPQQLLVTTCALICVAWIGCDGLDGLESDPGRDGCISEAADDPPLQAGAARDIRDRADAAFESLADGRTRFETRIGPQPWPRDLPENWPTPSGGLVLADTDGREEGRLLLVDLAGSIDQALLSYQTALLASGFEVDREGTVGGGKALRAQRGSTKATLRFFAREDSTRLEILFIAQ